MSWLAESYARPDFNDIRLKSLDFSSSCASADSAAAFLAVVEDWNRLRATVDTHANLAMVRYSQNTEDSGARAEQEFWDRSAPVVRELDVLYARTLLESRFHGALDDRYGAQLLALKRCQATTFVPEIADDLAREAALQSEYVELLSRSEAELRGRKIGLSELAKYFDDVDRQTRLEAHQAQDRFLAGNAAAFDSYYDQLVALRDRMGKALGHASYIPLAYQLRGRIGYGPDEVAAFRDAIREEIVPLASQIHAEQAAELGVDRVLYHDEPAWLAAGNPRPRGGDDATLDGAQDMYRELHGELGDFFALMRDEQLLDVGLRPGKAGGGFCADFADLGLPFVFANFNGSASDILVITHECGHAFQAYSSRHLEPRVEYTFPTYEAAEICSMSLEFLTYPWMDRFFGERAEDYRRSHLRIAITRLPYTVLVDHFQHDVYAHPEWSPDERNQRWLELERLYMPHRDYGDGFPYLARGTVWQRQLHIYEAPFYYIDYALARICSMQLWHRAGQNRARALADYLAMCRVGGSVPFLEIVAIGGLRSPFDPACIRDVAGQLRRALD